MTQIMIKQMDYRMLIIIYKNNKYLIQVKYERYEKKVNNIF